MVNPYQPIFEFGIDKNSRWALCADNAITASRPWEVHVSRIFIITDDLPQVAPVAPQPAALVAPQPAPTDPFSTSSVEIVELASNLSISSAAGEPEAKINDNEWIVTNASDASSIGFEQHLMSSPRSSIASHGSGVSSSWERIIDTTDTTASHSAEIPSSSSEHDTNWEFID